MQSMLSKNSVVVVLVGALLCATASAFGNPCTVVDNGTGTVTLPPAGCDYLSPTEVHEILDGLPPGTTIEFAPIHKDFICHKQDGTSGFPNCPPPNICEGPDGSGGNVDCFDSNLEMQLQGTGVLAGFVRTLFIPVSCQVHTGPRTPGDPVQSFPSEMTFLQGQLFGDPDFQQLTITGGAGFGLPSPGHTTLKQMPGGNFAVDSFFDITYRIDFVGAPGGALDGMSGSTTATIRMSAGDGTALGGNCVQAGDDCWSTECGATHVDFSGNPIPPGFFDPGSDPFIGTIQLGGGAGAVDTVVRRLDKMCFPEPLPTSATVPVEIVQLDLVSCQPIQVGNSGLWEVQVDLSSPQPQGQMTATKLDANGGVFSATLFVQPVYTFTRVGNPGDIRVLDTGAMGMPPAQLHTAGNAPWSTDETFDQCTPDGFAAGFSSDDGTPCCVEVCHSSFGQAPHEHCTRPPECPECIELCQPDPTATTCEPVACADANDICTPRCVRTDPLTGQTWVLDCDCRSPNECHVDFVADATPQGGGPVLDDQASPNPCVVTDNGTGTVTLPPAGCEYLSPDEVHQILDGLPAGTTIEFAPIHKDFICEQTPGASFPGCPPPGLCEQGGGSLGGQTDCFGSTLQMEVNGTGALGGFARTLFLPIACQVETAPRTPNDPVQDFDTQMNFLQGELFGDPDFCTLRVTGGTGFGLPSPGHTTLTRLPGGDFTVDSFFDITYQIEFAGCPGSVLDGMAGTTTATIRMQTGSAQTCTGACPVGTTCVERRSVNANGTIDLCCDCIPDQPIDEACCFGDGTCADMPAGACLANGGTPQGAGTDCTTVICPGAPCEPLPDGSACRPADCTVAGNECLPRCVRTNPFTGQSVVVDCDCRSPNECHVDLAAGAVGQAGQSGPVLDDQATPNPCVVADNGSGTVTLPPLGCDYLTADQVHEIIDGLPANTTIELDPIHTPQFCGQDPTGAGFPGCPAIPGICEEPGGGLGGNVDCFNSDLQVQLTGTGDLAGFSRNLTVPVACQVETAPRNPGDPVQGFDTQMNFLQGELFGDPDFCVLKVTGGTGFGLPSPGHTTLTQLPSGDFAVDSFFDITYQIEFAGCPGSVLDGMAGTTQATIRMQTGSAQSCTGDCPPGTICVETKTVNPDGSIETCCDCVPDTTPCEPLPDGSGCSQGNCPAGMECVPTCSEVNLATGEVIVTACDCKPIDECHLELDAAAVTNASGGAVAEGQAGSGNPCDVVDNGSGTVTLPPAGCEYLSPDEVHEILNGLPAGTTIEFAPIHKDFICGDRADFPGCPPPLVGCEQPGGSQGGDIDCFESQLEMALQGTGSLAGFNRNLSIPVVCQAETGPKSPGADEQTFSTQMSYLQGELFGDPDFCMLRVTGGDGFGLPSPGQTTLTRLPNGNFAVDSFFDITYQIEFQGCPGSVLQGMAGTTTATIRMATGSGMPKCVGTCPAGTVCEEQITQLGASSVEVCCVCEDCVPDVIKAVSRGHHGNAGPFDIDINLTPPATSIEMRRCAKQIVVTFDVPVEPCDGTLDTEVSVNVGNITNLTLNGNELTIDLDSVPDPSCLRIHLEGFCCVGGTVPMAPRDLHLIILGGDVNSDGIVNILDLSAVKTMIITAAGVGDTTFQADLNCSGNFNILDLSQVKEKLSQAAPPCP